VKLPVQRRGASVAKPSGTAPKRSTRLCHPGCAVERGYGAVALQFLPAAPSKRDSHPRRTSQPKADESTLFREAAGHLSEGE
jgi:hypothetical protein